MLAEIGEEGQRKLRATSVLIVGAGGLGAAVATYLTGAGVGRIGLADPDTVSLSNLQRQVLYAAAQVGMPKRQSRRRKKYGPCLWIKEKRSYRSLEERPKKMPRSLPGLHRQLSDPLPD